MEIHTASLQTLQPLFEQRDIRGIIQHVRKLMGEPDFSKLQLQWSSAGKMNSAKPKVPEVAALLLQELEAWLDEQGVLDVNDDFFTLEQQLNELFGEQVANIYIKTVMPTGFISVVRQNNTRGDGGKLSEKLVEQYKNELIRIDHGLESLLEVLQKHSHFPIKHVKILSRLVERLYLKAKSDYKFISIKPYFQKLLQIAEVTSEVNCDKGGDQACISLFSRYQDGSPEPPIIRQIEFYLALDQLLMQLAQREIVSRKEYKESTELVSKISGYRADQHLDIQFRNILEETLVDIFKDRDAILNKLAYTFLDEYRCAEELMVLRHKMICRELAYTNEYLKRKNFKDDKTAETNQEKVRMAQEKTQRLTGIFTISEALREAAAQTSTLELERIALGLSTSVSPEQLTDWIRIYSIIFSNADFLAYADQPVDFSIMRQQISNLSTFHLTLSVAELKSTVERGLDGGDEENIHKFNRFNDALKHRLQGLIQKKEGEGKSFLQMVKELEFLQDNSVQFVIADTFEGFQLIADAFTASQNDYFVKDRTAMMEESRKLYNQICEQCLKHFVYKPARSTKAEDPDKGSEKKVWYKRIFSSA